MKLKAIVRLIKETLAEWQKDKVPILAAALAYYTVFSLAPLLIIVIAIAGFAIGQEAAQEQLIGEVQNLIGAEGAASVQNPIQNSYQPKSGILPSILAIATLIFGATTAFAQLKEALNIIWQVKPQQQRGGVIGFILTRVLSFIMVLGIGILLLLSLVLSALLTGISNWLERWLTIPAFIWQIGDLTISFGLVTLLFASIYRFLPDVKIAWSDLWMGSAITAGLFTLGKGARSLYISVAAPWGRPMVPLVLS